MSHVTTLGIDLAKNVFQVCGLNRANNIIFNKAVKRNQFLDFVSNYPDALIAMEACGGAHHWSRELAHRGLNVKLIPAQHVAALSRGNKNDAADALAIAEAAHRPNIYPVQTKTVEQQDIQVLLRIRSKIKEHRKDNVNQIRGLLAEYGLILPQGLAHIASKLPLILEDAENQLTPIARRALNDLLNLHLSMTKRIVAADKELNAMAAKHETANQLMVIRGIGPITALALYACIGKATQFKNARQLSAWLGLVPKQHGTGGIVKLSGISKRGNAYLRTLLIHGARTVINWSAKRDDDLSHWAKSVANRRGKHKAIVALANKTARMVWVVLRKGKKALPRHYLSGTA